MSSLIKYRVHEVAKDFRRPTKEITDILTKYATTPKNHMQVLEDGELSIIFDYLTQHNQVKNIESIFADTYHESKPAQEAKPAAKQPAAPAPQGQKNAQGGQSASKQGGGQQPQKGAQPSQKPQGQGQNPAAPLASASRKVPEKKIVDTRKSGNVNLEKYDQRLEDLAAGKTKQMQAGKQKFQGRNQQRRGGGFQGSKRRAEEQEKMRRLQAEIAKKHPLVVTRRDRRGRAGLPDEEDRRRGGQVPHQERGHGLPQRRHRLRHRRHHRGRDGLQGGEGGHRHHRGEAHRHRRG